mmetsp:Transcript_105956/g.299556  ORF Transcript_105956/g.299556 Transcript_105956/m.299556 type:complete len:221 (+) Transcript_105956:825-1487(+)
MAAVVDRALETVEKPRGAEKLVIVPALLMRTIVGGEEYNCVVRNASIVQCQEHTANGSIQQGDGVGKVALDLRPARLVRVLAGRKAWARHVILTETAHSTRVGRRVGEVEEEGLACGPALPAGIENVLHCLCRPHVRAPRATGEIVPTSCWTCSHIRLDSESLCPIEHEGWIIVVALPLVRLAEEHVKALDCGEALRGRPRHSRVSIQPPLADEGCGIAR